MSSPSIGRRRLLAATAVALTLSGCQTGHDDSTPEPSPTGTTRETRTTEPPSPTTTTEPTDTLEWISPTERDLPTPTPTRPPEEVEEMTDIHLEEEGLSPGDSLDPYFDEYLRSGNRLIVPEGEYTHSEGRRIVGMTNMGIVGDGRVVIDQGEGYTNAWKHKEHSGRYELKNIVWKGTGGAGINRGPWGSFGAGADGEIVVENCAWPDGTEDESDVHCIYVPPEHEGDLLIRDTHIEGFGDNGLYGSAPGRYGGTVRVERCLFKDNNVANVRLGSNGSYVKDSVLIQTGRAPLTHSGHRNDNNVKLRQGGDIRVENCDLVHDGERWTLTIHGDVSNGSVEMVDNRIRHTSLGDVCNNNPDVDVIGENNHFTGEWDSSIPRDIFTCINDDCQEPSTDWP